jgi:sulfur-carrier protein
MTGLSIQVRYFAWLREALGEGEIVAVPLGTTVEQLRKILQAHSALHAQMLAHHQVLRCAVNHVLCSGDAVVPAGAELAFFPPVTGG